jgi:PAS domain S-box-containing protein
VPAGIAAGLLGIAFAGYRRRIARAQRVQRELRALADNAPDVVIRFDHELRIRYVNAVVEAYTGRPPAALLGRTVGELGFPADNVREWERGLREVLETGQPGAMEFTFETPAGTRHFESRFVPERGADGVTRSLLGITRDVTERRRAENAFRRSEAFLSEGQRISHTGSWSWNRVTGALAWSDELYRMYGADPTVARPWTTGALEALFWARVHPADRAFVQRTFEQAMRDFTPVTVEYRIMLPDGTVKYIRSEGRSGGEDYIGTTVDISAIRSAEGQLRRSEAYLAEGQRLSRTGSWGWTLATGEIFWSREMFRIYGFDPADGTPAYETVLARAHPDDALEVDRALAEAFRTGTELRLLTRILVPGEPMKWVETHGHPVRNEDGVLVELIGTVIDVTERRRADLRLRRAIRARYEAVLAERSRIARELHDTILSEVAGIAMRLDAAAARTATSEVAETAPPPTMLLAALRDQAYAALANARRSVTDLRALTEGVPPLPTLLADAVRRVFADTAVDARVEHEGVPCSFPPALQDEVLRIVGEALTNARRHAECRTVVVRCTYGPRALRIRIRDDGRGFVPAVESQHGHWGLVGMRERAAAIGARLIIASAPGRGTDVRLVVPIRARAASPGTGT